jgi:hypothetical protein
MDGMGEEKGHCDIVAARHLGGKTSDSEVDGGGEEEDIEGVVDEEIGMNRTQCHFSASL